MLSSAIVLLALASYSFAVPAEPTPRLEVKLTGPTNVQSVDDVVVTAAVTNKGTETMKVLKYGSVLDNHYPSQSFVVTRNGEEAEFAGARFQMNMEALDDSDYVAIPPGKTVSVEHHVSALYDFQSLGPGTFSFAPLDTPIRVMSSGNVSQPEETAASGFTVDIAQDVAQRELAGLSKLDKIDCSDQQEHAAVVGGYAESKVLAAEAYAYIKATANGPLYMRYFGTTPTSTVLNIFENVANENSKARVLGCRDPLNVCDGRVIAYTVRKTKNVFFCDLYYDEVPITRLCQDTSVASRHVRGGTVLHELTHATSGTVDHGYGCGYDMSLARYHPAWAAENADNYNCFATEVYKRNRCVDL
ncbi:Metalloprotease [Trametes sanguinea]|nr:Metalloprotease [Trametes sanguinea]